MKFSYLARKKLQLCRLEQIHYRHSCQSKEGNGFQMAMQKSVKIIVNLQFVYLLRLTYKYLPLLIHKE